MKRSELFCKGSREDLKEMVRINLAKILADIRIPETLEEVVNDLEDHESYRELVDRWYGLDEMERRKGWNRLFITAREIAYARRPFCVRCGECCMKGSPTLHQEDLDLIKRGILSTEKMYTLRSGEIGYSPVEDESIRLSEERIKVREKEGSHQCLFYDESGSACTIYMERPYQCKILECWNPESYERAFTGKMLFRKDVVPQDGGIFKIVEEHERRCPFTLLESSLKRVGKGSEDAMKNVMEMLRYDYYLRSLIVERADINPSNLDFLFGRPLTETIRIFGLKVEREGEDAFRLVQDTS